MKFELKKVYDFTIKRVAMYNGEAYFVLAFDGNETMPGYEDDGWVFRVKVLPYQEDWEPEDLQGRVIPCFVQGYNVGLDARPTAFPILAQDIGSILRSKYKEGLSYDFVVIGVPGDEERRGGVLSSYAVSDEFGFRHYVRAEKGAYLRGECLKLRIRAIENSHLCFESLQEVQPAEYFEVGEVSEFTIQDEAQTAAGRHHYFIVKDGKKGLLHRFYPREEREESTGDTITLRVKGFSDKGWMVLEDPQEGLDGAEFNRIAQLEDEESLGTEGPKLEYKCSFVYTRNGELDIDRQLGYELMRHVAGFMNADGGLLCIGYYDDGTIRGINEDLKYINTSNEDSYTYELTEDKIKLKFINTIVNHLGSLAGSKVDIELQQNSRGRLVCFLRVAPSARPVWLNGKDLFIRCYNSVRLLRGPEITDYICERCGIAVPAEESAKAPAPVVALPQRDAVTPVATGNHLLVDLSPAEEDEQVWRYISLYADGCVSQQKAPAEGEDVLYNVPISRNHCKKSDRLLLCYDNGCVNVLNPKEVLDIKLTKPGKRYANGFNQEDGVQLLHACACHEDDYLVIRSRKANGAELVKAVCVEPYKVHNPQSMHTKGNTFVKTEWAQPVAMRVVPAAHTSFIYNIISKTSDKYGPGHSIDAPFCADALAYLEKRRQMEQPGS